MFPYCKTSNIPALVYESMKSVKTRYTLDIVITGLIYEVFI